MNPLQKVTPLVLYLVLVIVSFLIYANTLQNDFVRDDYDLILQHDGPKSLANIPGYFVGPFFPPDSRGTSPRYYRPLVSASFAVDYAVGGPGSPWVFHLTNVLFYCGCAAAVYALFRRLIRSRAAAFLAGLLFATHAVHTESVAWVSGRTDVMAALFMSLALVAVLRARERHSSLEAPEAAGPPLRLLAATFAFMLLALFCKEVALALLPLYVVLELAAPRAGSRPSPALRFAPGLALAAAAGVYLLLRWFALSGVETRAGTRLVEPWTAAGLATVANCVIHYLGKMALPLHLSADFEVMPFATVGGPWPLLALAGAAALLAVSVYATVRNWRVGLAVWLVWFSLAPVLHVVPIAETVAERFAFVPSIGFCLLMGLAAAPLLRRHQWRRSPAVAAAGALLAMSVAHGALTVRRNPDWRNDRTLSVSSVRTAPDVPRSHLSLGMVYENRKLYERAILHYRRAARLAEQLTFAGRRGHMPETHVRLAACARKLGRPEEALLHLEKASRQSPDNPAIHLDLARALEELADREGIEGARPAALTARGRALELLGRTDAAENCYRRALELHSDHYEALIRLARLHSRRGELRKALRQAERALRIRRTREARRLVEELQARVRETN